MMLCGNYVRWKFIEKRFKGAVVATDYALAPRRDSLLIGLISNIFCDFDEFHFTDVLPSWAPESSS